MIKRKSWIVRSFFALVAITSGHGSLADDQTSGQEELLMHILNPDGCGMTDRSPLTLRRGAKLNRLEVWYNFDREEETVDYTIKNRDGSIVHKGIMFRSECDPNQGNWCYASDEPAIQLQRGGYSVVTAKGKICQNQRSGGRGFIRAWGIPTR